MNDDIPLIVKIAMVVILGFMLWITFWYGLGIFELFNIKL